jgi:predicted transcriptional regulator of viral defense system
VDHSQKTIASATSKIARAFAASSQKIYSRQDIYTILMSNRKTWRIPTNITLDEFLAPLLREGQMHRVRVITSRLPSFERYVWGDVSPYEAALALRPNSYLSHGTAAFLQGLTKQEPDSIYVNREQSEKPFLSASPSQDTIRLAFSRPQRQTQFVVTYKDHRIVLLNGKHTDRLGVVRFTGPAGERLQVTNVERTLIDITVRPAYGSGVQAVLESFQAAKLRASSKVLLSTLKKLRHVYPYHQAIGFYLQRSGYDETDYERLRGLGVKLDFYLAHGMENPAYDSKWRVYYPENLN